MTVGAMNKNHLLNRLEDLQENMADFEHNFCTQYKVKRDLGDRYGLSCTGGGGSACLFCLPACLFSKEREGKKRPDVYTMCRAKQMFKQMKVKEAQNKHNAAQDSLYEL